MSYISLPRKYRPQVLDDAVGQQNIVKMLRNAIKLNRVGRAYLFIGPAGTGKTSFARIWSKEMNCSSDHSPCNKCKTCIDIGNGTSLDVIELNAADKRKIEDIRDCLERLRFRPTSGKYKILILDEVHMLTTESFNALLKDLEEPPEWVIFILCTTNPEKIPSTIISRCQTFQFKAIKTLDIAERLSYICDEEGFTYDEEAINLIAEFAKGGMRDAISSLEQIACFGDNNITIDNVVSVLGLIDNQTVDNIIEAVLSKDIEQSVDILNTLVEENKDIQMLFDLLLDRFRTLMKENLIHKESNYEISKSDCLIISKVFIEYERVIKYSDKYYAMICLLNALVNLESFDISNRITKLEQMIKTGNMISSTSTVVDTERIERIKNKLNTSTAEPIVDTSDQLVKSIIGLSKGRVIE